MNYLLIDPVLQYGPNDGGYAVALQIALVAIGIIFGAWLFGSAVALITSSVQGKSNSNNKK